MAEFVERQLERLERECELARQAHGLALDLLDEWGEIPDIDRRDLLGEHVGPSGLPYTADWHVSLNPVPNREAPGHTPWPINYVRLMYRPERDDHPCAERALTFGITQCAVTDEETGRVLGYDEMQQLYIELDTVIRRLVIEHRPALRQAPSPLNRGLANRYHT